MPNELPSINKDFHFTSLHSTSLHFTSINIYFSKLIKHGGRNMGFPIRDPDMTFKGNVEITI